ncbi:MAG: protein jag [Epsilonproteobacteria bacterium]|nr:MAG: protein jag [Campylobacterota bacterium]
MVKIEAKSLEDAYLQAAHELSCSVTELDIVVIQQPKKKILGMLGKNAIIVANCKVKVQSQLKDNPTVPSVSAKKSSTVEPVTDHKNEAGVEKVSETLTPIPASEAQENRESKSNTSLSIKTILPEFLSKKEDKTKSSFEVTKKVNKVIDNFFEDKPTSKDITTTVKNEVNDLFEKLCLSLNAVEVSAYDDTTLLIEFSGEDAALLIGKEGYRYKALSYMLFNWINSKYKMQLRLEIAEFLKNQEESVARYLMAIYDEIDAEGNSQTKVLDGVLIQIALQLLRERYHNKYVAIRSTRDGGKYIIINDYNKY